MVLPVPDLNGKVAIITGGSRGIGRETALAMARQGCKVCVAAKSITEKPNLPGTIFTVAKEIEALGVEALPFQLDVRNDENAQACIDAVVEKWGRIDILINNASALWITDIVNTPMKKYDLVNQVICRGSFMMASFCLPHMFKNGYGRVICLSPPINPTLDVRKCAYTIAKFGSTATALGVSYDYKGKDIDITGNTLWPAAAVESAATRNFKVGDTECWRKPSIMSDCVLAMLAEPSTFTGNMLIDERYLLTKGMTMEDMDQKYSVTPGTKLMYIYSDTNDDAVDWAVLAGIKKQE